MGSEMIMARQFGFVKIYGVEVDQILVDATKKRLRDYSDMYPVFYDGIVLPYEDGQFNVVASGHVIEHTSDPRFYMQEILRVLAPGGFLLLEFPHRYYIFELHTGLLSFEWLPRKLRNLVLLKLSSRFSPLSENVKQRYTSIVTTNLQQISMGGIMRMMHETGYSTKLLSRRQTAAGIISCVIYRN
jgi:ubiquinone/menaquinone biosynthesis C-methylase UbiE